MNDYKFVISESHIGKRLDVFASEMFDELTRSAAQKLISENAILINDSPKKNNYLLRKLDEITVNLPKPENTDILPENIPLDIIYEDDSIILINKPKNMVVHPAPGHYTDTIVNALLHHCGDTLSGINGIIRPGIVHRIDKDTTGIIVSAKTNEAHINLSQQLAEHSIVRKYYTIVHGNVKADEGTIDKPINRSKSDRKKMAVDSAGRNAVTHYRVIERFMKYTFVEVTLETGRTHQIRVHMSSIGHPILGDIVYGSEKQPFKLDSQVLHAGILGFVHPKTNEYMEFNTNLPEYFEYALMKVRY